MVYYLYNLIYIFVDFFFISQSLFDGSPGSRENSNGFNRVTGPQELFVLLRSEQKDTLQMKLEGEAGPRNIHCVVLSC